MILRILQRVVYTIGVKTIILIALIIFVLGSAAYGFAGFVEGLDHRLLLRIVFLSVISVGSFARMKIRSWMAGIAISIIGILFLFILIGSLGNPILAYLKAFLTYCWDVLNFSPDFPIDEVNIKLAYAEVYYGIAGLVDQLWNWYISIKSGKPSFNENAVSLIWGLSSWFLASWMVWSILKHNRVLIGILPTGVLLSAGLTYTWHETYVLAPFLFSTILLMAFVNFDVSEKNWVLSKMDYPEDLSKEFSFTIATLTIVIVSVSMLIPVISIKKIIEFTSQFTQPQIEKAEPVIQSFGLEQSGSSLDGMGVALRGGFPRDHLMGSGPELSEKLVMTVKISGEKPEDLEVLYKFPLYWRSLTYDEYLGNGWTSTDTKMQNYQAGDEIAVVNAPYHRTIQQDYRMTRDQAHFIYSAGDILTTNEDFSIAYRLIPDETDILRKHGDIFGGSIDQYEFKVQSIIPVVDERLLRTSQEVYPEWVSNRYLALPDNVPMRVIDLAEEVTENDHTIYDKARSLESFLRSFEYTLDVDAPPAESDVADYFLFELKKGYCDYYASSMAVMARSMGIPARLAIGYYRGIYDDVNDRFIVTEADAHTWVEIYFKDIGWVPFEPTAGRSMIERNIPNLDFGLEGTDREFDLGQESNGRDSGLNWNFTLCILFAGFGGIIVYIMIDNYKLQSSSPFDLISNLFQKLYRYGSALEIQVNKDSTPNEFSSLLESRIKILSRGAFIEEYLLNSILELRHLTNMYSLARYSPRELSHNDKLSIIQLWKRLRRRLMVAQVMRFYKWIFRRANVDYDDDQYP